MNWNKNKKEIIFLGSIFLLAIVLRLITLKNMGELWGDELFSWSSAYSDTLFGAIKQSYNFDVHTPLYFTLLHIWMKLFSDSTFCMRYLSFLISLPLVLFGYFFAKEMFNQKTARYCALIFAINTFCIYYSCEIRMYAINLVLSLPLAYTFIKLIEKFNKKYIILYIFFSFLLMLNFATSIILIFCYFIVGLIYLLIEKKDFIYKYIKIHIAQFLISLPVIYWIGMIVLRIQNALISLPKDIYIFKSYGRKIILGILENFFALENYQITSNNLWDYHGISYIVDNPLYVISVLIPIAISIFLIAKALLTKNKKLYLFLFPSLLFVLISYFLAMLNIGVLQIRYLTIVFPVVIIVMCFGLSSFKNENESRLLFILLILLMIINPIKSKKTIFNLKRVQYYQIAPVLEYIIQIKNDDILFIPYVGRELNYYVRHPLEKTIPFQTVHFLALGDTEGAKIYLGDDYQKINRNNIKEFLFEEAKKDIAHPIFEKNFYNLYIKPLNKGQRVIYVMIDGSNIEPMTKYNYEEYSQLDFLYSKVERDCFLIMEKYLKRIQNYEVKYPTKKMIVFIYQK